MPACRFFAFLSIFLDYGEILYTMKLMTRKNIIKVATISIGLFFAFPSIRSAFADTPAVPYLCELGASFYRIGSYNDALSEFNKALILDPTNKTALQYVNDIFAKEIAQEYAPAESATKPSKKGTPNQQNSRSLDARKSEEKNNAINNAFYIAAAYDANRIHYSEWADEEKLDEDYGKHTGYYITLGYRSPNYYEWAQSKPFVEAYFRRFSDIIHYKGALQGGGATIPYDTDQRSVVQQYGLKLGGSRDCFSDKGTVLAYLDAGERIWNRGEDDNIYNYGEKYYWTYIGFGAGLNYKLIPKLSIGGEGEVMFAPSGLRKMHADAAGGFPDITYNLGLVWGVELKAPIKYYLLKNLSLDVTPYFTYWKINRSNYVSTYGFYSYEPKSYTHLEGLLAGFTYSF